MHSFGYRANALLTFAVTALVLMCATVSFSVKFSNQNPSFSVKFSNQNPSFSVKFSNQNPSAQIQVNLKLNITGKLNRTGDLQSSSFIWNTKQGHNLPGKDFNLTLQWAGEIFADKIVMSGYQMHTDDED